MISQSQLRRDVSVFLLTPFLPIESAIGPLVIAPNIAPKVSKEPNSENCRIRGKCVSKTSMAIHSKSKIVMFTSAIVRERSFLIAA